MPVHCLAYLAASVDGYIAGPGGDIEWLHRPEFSGPMNGLQYEDVVAGVDALVMGRNSFEKALSFDAWPYRELPVVVLTHRPIAIPPELSDRVGIDAGPPDEIVGRLERRGWKRLYIDGGATLQGFLRAGLINELTITWIPILLGDGIPLFGSLGVELPLTLVGSVSSANGFVQTRYRLSAPNHGWT